MACSYLRNCNIFYLILCITLYIHLTYSQNCSAINAYVQIISPSYLANRTLTSSQALFPPYSYYIPSTELTQLSSTDNICNASEISTDLSNKIVLIFKSDGNCTDHYKVYVAEQNNAIAVLLAYDENEVINIIDDNTITGQGITTTIPMRSIPRDDGITLSDAITSGINI